MSGLRQGNGPRASFGDQLRKLYCWCTRRQAVRRAVRAAAEPLERRALLSVSVSLVSNAPNPSDPHVKEGDQV
jgi:hypothetical protein